ncbi:MAG: 23S rRNA (guanosine(2251)-2'-O)-methyltransferase RlmB [Bacteroidetes bacterium]|nr:23S rRNA (guanosine(2251)-2'-O)-methyltransferase RlmB [Bacteroidota bacterium]
MKESSGSGIYIYGKKPIEEALLADPKNVKIVYIRETVRDIETEEIRKFLSKNKIPLVKTPEKKLVELVGDVNDQGFVAELKEFKSLEFNEWLSTLDKEQNPLVFVLDELEDPHNVGAVVRVAAASGAAGVILSKHRQAPINATVFKTSAGTVAKLPIVVVSNTNDTIKKLKDEKFWVVGLDSDAQKSVWDETYDTPIAVVIGNEGRGVREKTREACDYLLRIPMERGVESLNASVSAGVVAYEWKRRNLPKN